MIQFIRCIYNFLLNHDLKQNQIEKSDLEWFDLKSFLYGNLLRNPQTEPCSSLSHNMILGSINFKRTSDFTEIEMSK